MLDLARNGLYDLDAGRADPDDADTLAGEVDRLLRPAAGVNELPLEHVLSGKDVCQGRRQHPAARHQELRVDRLARVGFHGPAVGCIVEVRAGDGGFELDVLPQVEPVGDIVQPAFNLRLAGKFLAPAPSLVEFFGEQVLVDIGLGVEPGTGIPVPVPRAADVRGRVVGADVQSLFPAGAVGRAPPRLCR